MKQEYELVSKQGSAFPSRPIADTSPRGPSQTQQASVCGGKVTKKTSKLKVKTPLM